MTQHTFDVQFQARARITVDDQDPRYEHYFEDNEARGGVKQLAEDLFYDNVDLDQCEHIDEGSFDFLGKAHFSENAR